MAYHKNKIQLLDKEVTKFGISDGIQEYRDPWNYSDGYDYYWDNCYNDRHCDCSRCTGCDDYDYLEDGDDEFFCIFRGGNRRSLPFILKQIKIGRRIDMMSVYSKEILREKKIDAILGLSSDFTKSKTLGDLKWNK